MELKQCPLTSETRHKMIADAAYYLSRHRISDNSNSIDNWLAAEAKFEEAFTMNCVSKEEKSQNIFWAKARSKMIDLIEKAGKPYADNNTINEYLW